MQSSVNLGSNHTWPRLLRHDDARPLVGEGASPRVQQLGGAAKPVRAKGSLETRFPGSSPQATLALRAAEFTEGKWTAGAVQQLTKPPVRLTRRGAALEIRFPRVGWKGPDPALRPEVCLSRAGEAESTLRPVDSFPDAHRPKWSAN